MEQKQSMVTDQESSEDGSPTGLVEPICRKLAEDVKLERA